jgi:predicted DNA repair protein MutK
MPKLLTLLTVVGTAAMLWVGGSILIHGLEVLGWPWLYDEIHHIAVAVAGGLEQAAGFVEWTVTALLDGIFGLAVGVLLIPVVTRVGALFGNSEAH